MHKQIFTTTLAGKELTAEFSDLTEHANGSVLLKYGDTTILVTAVMSKYENQTGNYFPLSVEFEEKFYAAGKLLGSRYSRREGRPSEEAILSARLIDRTIRPLFNQSIRHDIQVIVSVLAIGDEDPDTIAVIGASLALGVSDIPWRGPVGAVRIAREKNSQRLLMNPNYEQRTEGVLDFELVACGKEKTLNMIETAGLEIAEAAVIAALEVAQLEHAATETWQQEIIAAIGKTKMSLSEPTVDPAVVALFSTEFSALLRTTIFSQTAGKEHIYKIKNDFLQAVTAAELSTTHAGEFFESQIDSELHAGALERQERADGRTMDEVRTLFAQAGGISPALHGSGIFYRGGTHIFSALTLGGPDAAQLIESVETAEYKKRFMHHYNFPPFSVGDTGRVGGFNRRMIGHGSLAEKALLPVIPTQEEFPYTIRLVSETLASNGSSSMGSVCASSLALLDGGVPITRPVAGIASGVMMAGDTHVVLTDIQGPEDEFGDMDFKVAGTTVGITAMQMDVKVDGVPVHILVEALEKARLARLHILETITHELSTHRTNISSRAPQIIVLSILPAQIGLVIGGGGKTINAIRDETGVEDISIEDDGSVFITGKNGSAELAAEKIRTLTRVYEVGEAVEVTIVKVVEFGAFAKIDAHHEGLIHISEIAPFHVEKINGLLEVGEVIPVVVSKVDQGKIGLSIKQRDPEFASKRGLKPNTNSQ